MSGYNIMKNPNVTPATSLEQWASNYKERNIEVIHDHALMNLATPDDSILVVGPPRLAQANGDAKFYTVGLVNMIQYTEASQVAPMKAIGSRRHIFSKSNAPVSGSIGRLVILGPNLYRALYAVTEIGSMVNKPTGTRFSKNNEGEDSWYTNLEEDLFRIPIGIGVIYASPSTSNAGGKTGVGADYLESVVLQSRSIAQQTGSTMIMEQVSFLADRVVPWGPYCGNNKFSSKNPSESLLS